MSLNWFPEWFVGCQSAKRQMRPKNIASDAAAQAKRSGYDECACRLCWLAAQSVPFGVKVVCGLWFMLRDAGCGMRGAEGCGVRERGLKANVTSEDALQTPVISCLSVQVQYPYSVRIAGFILQISSDISNLKFQISNFKFQSEK